MMRQRWTIALLVLGVAATAFADPPVQEAREPAALEALRKARGKAKPSSPNPAQTALTEHRGEGTTPNAAVKAMQAAGRRVKREQARKLRHQDLQARLQGRETPAAMRSELRTHARRVSRLQRIRQLASDADPALLTRIDQLIERENARHERRLAGLIARAPQAKAAPDDEREHDDEVEE